MAEQRDEPGAGRLKVFVSYSRTDIDFADELVLALEDKGFDPLLDRHDIDAAEKWKDRLGALILSCDTVVFVLTEKSAGSPICRWEVEEAARLGKRMIPVTPHDPGDAAPPPQLGELNYISFYKNPNVPGSSFYDGVRKLERALKVDLTWLRAQTRLSEQAAEWQRARADDLLLRGVALDEALAWRSQAPAGAIPPALVSEFLAASEAAGEQRKAEAAVQIAEREAALSDKEAAVARSHAADRLARRATLIGAGVAILLTIIAGFGNWFAARATADASAGRSALFARESLALPADTDRPLAILMALHGDPAARRGWIESWLDGKGYASARSALVTAATHNSIEHLVDTGASVTAIAWSRDGRFIVTGSSDGNAFVWPATGGVALATFDHGSRVVSVAFSPDGARVLTGSEDGKARVWPVGGGAALATFDHAGRRLYSVAFSPDGARVLTGSSDGKARVWPAGGGAALATIDHGMRTVYSVAFSPDGARVLTGSFDGKARVWPVGGGAALATFDHGMSTVYSVAFSPDGARVLTGSDDGKARVWPAGGGAALATFDHGRGTVYSAFSPDGARVLTGSEDGKARVWPAAGGAALATFDHGDEVRSVAFSPDGARVLTGSFDDGKARVWPVGGGAALATFDHGSRVVSVAFSPDGARLLTGSDDGRARVWPATGGAALATFDHGGSWVWSVAFSPDGARVLTGSGNGTARVWEIPRIVLAPAGEQVRLACAMLRSIGYTKFSPADRDRLPILQGEPDNVCPR